jgi:hypothetical protein
VKQGDIVLARNADKYPLRLKAFSDGFFPPVPSAPVSDRDRRAELRDSFSRDRPAIPGVELLLAD